MCQTTLSLTNFYKRLDAYTAKCKSCSKQAAANYFKINQKAQIQKRRDWALRNPQKVRTLNQTYRNNNKEKIQYSGWRYRNKYRKRQALLKNVGFNELSFIYALNHMGEPCLYCGQPSVLVDHMLPKSRGGNSEIGNLALCCATCNLVKGNRTVEEFNQLRARQQYFETVYQNELKQKQELASRKEPTPNEDSGKASSKEDESDPNSWFREHTVGEAGSENGQVTNPAQAGW